MKGVLRERSTKPPSSTLIFAPATDEDTKTTRQRARTIELHGIRVPLASPEETIAHKGVYGSKQNLDDARASGTASKERSTSSSATNEAKISA